MKTPDRDSIREASQKSRKIADQMEKVLTDENLDWDFAFSFYRTYADAPDPLLNVTDVGSVGVPVTACGAEALRAQATLGRRRNAAKRGFAWEVDANKINFSAARWEEFIEKSAQDVIGALNIDTKGTKSSIELCKLIGFGKGSDDVSADHLEKKDHTYATMLVLLSSEHTGGAVRLSQHGLSLEYDPSQNQTHTTVLAWRPNTTLDLSPITTGTRIALAYTLSSPTKLPRARRTDSTALTRLGAALSAWHRARNAPHTPHKLVCVLAHTYAPPLTLSALQGVDAGRAAALAGLAPAHGFKAGLAALHAHDPSEAHTVTYHLEDLVAAASGAPLARSPPFDAHAEAVPRELRGEVDARGRTALVLWPCTHHLEILYSGPAGLARLCTALAAARTPDADARALLAALLARRDGDAHVKAGAGCAAAVRWGDAGLWCEVVGAYAPVLGLGVVPDEAKFGAAEAWTFGAVKDAFEAMFRASATSSEARFAFLHALYLWQRGVSDAQRKKVTRGVLGWIKVQRRVIKFALKAQEGGAEGDAERADGADADAEEAEVAALSQR
ncbi:hypothetical protein PsYK624_034430 [Phanerochaete sordida]|uniref:Fe2OG dioxygenase domain-containing protein n=1 Tax=Phanerochaete sordida TaxID=48140 RepID=A0A9P3G4C1_9APHY|nr:hypothetical protein PsYK624_034430 [Phanerochaete sordida]